MASPQLQTDLLHPLTSLHWKRCHTPPWRNYGRPTHCAALQDTVAVLTFHGDLFISSTDLRSWTRTISPYRCMSLTTYQSKFVLVGGRHHPTNEVTNTLHTSATGRQWESSLPPMPTERYDSSSVSTRSPEMLIVAGGSSQYNRALDVVEVLHEDKWTTVDPLPAPATCMSSKLHDGNLHFIGGRNQGTTVYTCSYSSLISSVTESTSTTSTDSPLWKQYQAPGVFTNAVSCSSRLANIDHLGTVRGYCNISQSWVEATSTGDIPNENTSLTAITVLTTGDIVYCDGTGGVYRVSVSVSPYSPELEFPRNALTRLEAVMGIQIVSVLANLHSPLTSSSGVKLQRRNNRYGGKIALPDPDQEPAKFVVEVVLQWSAGHSLRPPTWRQLLTVLQDIGLVPLSQQIEEFLKGEFQFTSAYRHFVSTKEALEILSLKILFSGPPRQGKTSARRRLEGEIVDLTSAGEADLVQPSTGAVESGSNMIVKSVSSSTAVVTEAEWHAVKSLEEEAGMLLHNLAGEMATRNAPTTTPARAMDVRPVEVQAGVGEATATTPTTTSSNASEIQESGFFSKLFSKFKRKVPKRITSSTLLTPQAKLIDIPEVVHLLKQVMKEPNFLKEVKHSFRAYIRMEDTGGQPELMDMLPALTLGPALCLVFFNLEWNLKKEFPVFYQHPSRKTTAPEESKITLEEMLLSMLSSISCSSASVNSLRGEETNSSDMREILESSKSVAYFVGTHKDKVTEEEIFKFDSDLQSIIRGTDFFEKGIVQFSSEGTLIVAMDNMTGGVEEVSEVRKILHRAMEKHFRKLKIPAVWLIFSQCLQMTEKRTASFESCLELSSQFNMSAYETKVALWFLHHHAGVLMYFPDIPLLADLVILDNQVVYDSVTFLILGAMSFDSVGQARAEKFRKTGQFVMTDLVAATNHASGDIIPPEKLAALLEFLHMVAPIPPVQDSVSSTDEEQEIVYLMPCVLHTASKEKLDAMLTDESRPECIAPLMIRYTCGFVPLGIFPALIASLIGNKAFDLVKRDMMKNKIQFYFRPLQILVTFLCYPKFYAIVISELPIVEHELHEECVALRKAVAASLEKVNSRMNYGSFLDYQFAFECPNHLGREHLCVVEEKLEDVKVFKCLQNFEDKKPVKMDSIHEIWLHKPGPHTSIIMSSNHSIKLLDQNLTCGDIMQALHEFPSSKARELGMYLDLPLARLEEFSHNNPRECRMMMQDVISHWLEVDKDKSWMKLAGAVEACGHAGLADTIRSKNRAPEPTPSTT